MTVGVYIQIIESLMYLMNCIRPDIAYVVSILSRYTSNPSDDHWTALLLVVGYLKNTKEHTVRYSKYPHIFERDNDANWIADFEESKSPSGYIFTLGGATVSWKSSKQTCITHSTMESKFIALNKAGEKVKWFR